MITEKDIELIDKYLSGELSGSSLAEFEQRLNSDTQFTEEVRFIKDLKVSAKQVGRRELKDKLQSIARTVTIESENKRFSLLRKKTLIYYSIAASIVIIIGVSAIFYFQSDKSLEQLAEDNNKDTLLIDDSIISKKAEIETLLADKNIKTVNKNIYFIDNNGFGYYEIDKRAARIIKLGIIENEKYANNYFLTDTILFLFGDFEDDKIKLFEKHKFILLNYNKYLYKVNKSKTNIIAPLIIEEDSAIIRK